MRRVMLLLAAIAIMVVLFAAVAYAATIEGTSEGEVLLESSLNDTIYGRGGADEIYASFAFNGVESDKDVVYGNKGGDYIDVADGDDRDTAIGGAGNDECVGEPGDELKCEAKDQ